MYEINERIRAEMRRQNMTNVELAKRSGLNRSSISRYINDVIEPKQNAIGAIAKALGVSPAYLLGFDDVTAALDVNRLTEQNKMRLMAYYMALIDTQEGQNGDT